MAGKIDNVVANISKPILDRMGFELVDVEYKKEGSNWFLRIYIDKPGGVTISDCENVSKRVEKAIDDMDPIPHHYYLEVSSPGIDRPLKKDSDFEKYKGHKVELRLYKPLDGIKNITGELIGLKDDRIIIKSKDKIYEICRSDAAVVKLAVEF